MPQVLPLFPSIGNYRVSTTLITTQYILDVRWNGRDSAWYMDILTSDAEAILLGNKLLLGVLIGARTANPLFPTGRIIMSDLSGLGVDAGFDDLGSRVAGYFYTLEELEA